MTYRQLDIWKMEFGFPRGLENPFVCVVTDREVQDCPLSEVFQDMKRAVYAKRAERAIEIEEVGGMVSGQMNNGFGDLR